MLKVRNGQDAACDDQCPIKKTAVLIEGKWTTLIIRELMQGTKRYSEIQKSLDGISAKVLSDRLRLLERNKLLTRTVYPTIPPSTEYSLTKLGKKLEVVLVAMAEFGNELASETASESDSAELESEIAI